MTASVVLNRAYQWVEAKLPYCQSPNGAQDGDASCTRICERPRNPLWDPYRSDCSGLVSWAWGLPPPGRTTYGFAPAQSDITHVIDAIDLMPGDAVNLWNEHIMLFVRWVNKGTEAVFYEEPGCSSNPPYAHEVTTSVSISGSSIHVSWNGMTFQAIRLNAITGQAAALLVGEPSPGGPFAFGSPSASGGGGSNTGMIIGIVVAAVVLVAIVGAVLAFFCIVRRKAGDSSDSMVYQNPSFKSTRANSDPATPAPTPGFI